MLVKALRNGLGLIIVGLDRLTRPRKIQRSSEQQSQAQDAVKGLALYQLYACPFCVKVRRHIHRLNVDIEVRDIGKGVDYRQELELQGGRVMVPCLRIEDAEGIQWLYESSKIIQYLEDRIAS